MTWGGSFNFVNFAPATEMDRGQVPVSGQYLAPQIL